MGDCHVAAPLNAADRPYDIVSFQVTPDGVAIINVADSDEPIARIGQIRQLEIPAHTSEDIKDRMEAALDAICDVVQFADEIRDGQPRTISSASK